MEVSGVHGTQWRDFSSVCQEFPYIFDGNNGRYTGLPVTLQLDPQVRPIWLKVRQVPFTLKPKMN